MNHNKIIQCLETAINAQQKGLALFPNKNYDSIPKNHEKEIMKYCNECATNFKALREELDTEYSDVYRFFYEGGMQTDCRIGKNIWCFGLIRFARARLNSLKKLTGQSDT